MMNQLVGINMILREILAYPTTTHCESLHRVTNYASDIPCQLVTALYRLKTLIFSSE